MDRNQLAKVAKLNDPATPHEIAQARTAVGRQFPPEYEDLLTHSNGLLANDEVNLYAIEEIAERNATYEVGKYLPDWLMIGDDGGGSGIFLDLTKTPASVYRSDMGVFIETEATALAPSLGDWVASGFPMKYD